MPVENPPQRDGLSAVYSTYYGRLWTHPQLDITCLRGYSKCGRYSTVMILLLQEPIKIAMVHTSCHAKVGTIGHPWRRRECLDVVVRHTTAATETSRPPPCNIKNPHHPTFCGDNDVDENCLCSLFCDSRSRSPAERGNAPPVPLRENETPPSRILLLRVIES
ncbi:hypothetical protein BGW80DRAFT_759757 [Lactifluus volemus]|nr:hypothetical protein BGW80DRAFT_759757 [Lactifluus volemus]